MAKNKSHVWGLLETAFEEGAVTTAFLHGPPGTGKSSWAASFLAALNKKSGVSRVSLNEDRVVQELMGHLWPAESDKGTAIFKWVDGTAIRSFRSGGGLVVDETTRASGSILDFLIALLDDANSPVSSLDTPGGQVKRGESFRVICTANDDVSRLDPALRDRMQIIVKITHPHPEIIEKLDEAIPGLGKIVNNSYSDEKRAISTRKAQVFARLTKIGMTNREAANLAFEERAADVLNILLTQGVIKG